MPIPALHRLGCLLRVRRAAWRPMVPPPTKDHETVEIQTDAPFNTRVTQSHGPQAKPRAGLVARPYWLPVAPLSFSKMKPGVGWQGGPAPEGPRPLALHTVTAVASLGTGYRVECFSKGTVRSRAAASSRNQQSFPVLGWTSAAGSGFSSLSSKMRCVERAGAWGPPCTPAPLRPLQPSAGEITLPRCPGFKQSPEMGLFLFIICDCLTVGSAHFFFLTH